MLLYRTLLFKKMARAPGVIKKIYGHQARGRWEQNKSKFSFFSENDFFAEEKDTSKRTAIFF